MTARRTEFLSAGWRELILLNDAVPDVVAFDFHDTKVFGARWP